MGKDHKQLINREFTLRNYKKKIIHSLHTDICNGWYVTYNINSSQRMFWIKQLDLFTCITEV